MQAIDTEQLKQFRESAEEIPVINVLGEDAFRKKHIPESDNVPVHSDDFVQQVEKKVGSKDKKLVVYCASKECDASPTAAKKLEEAGFTSVYDYEGGIKAWEEAGEPLAGTAGGR